MSKVNIAFIFARGESQDLKNKNIKLFNNKPLISHTIKTALDSKLFDHVIVSTDSEQIADISKKHGAEVPFMRPKNLANNSSPELLSWKHAIKSFEDIYNKKIKIFASLPCTSPLRKNEDVINLIQTYSKNKFDIVVGITETSHSPDFNMVYKNPDKTIEMISAKPNITRRQDSKKCYNITTIGYISSPDYINKTNNIFEGRIGGCLIPKERSIDIDDIYDFEIAEILHNKIKNND